MPKPRAPWPTKKGTTTGYVAEEIHGSRIERGAFVTGRTYPEKGGYKLEAKTNMPEVILIKGQLQTNLPLVEAVKKLKPGDGVIKGANALYSPAQRSPAQRSSTSGCQSTCRRPKAISYR